MRKNQCAWGPCAAAILDTEFLCPKHLAILQSDTRAVLLKTFRPGRRPSQVFEATLLRAFDEILFFITNGHRMPAQKPFDFDDAGKVATDAG